MRKIQLWKRVVWVLAAACAFMVFVAVVHSQATPVRPDLNRLLQEPQERPGDFPLARAGWNGPEARPVSHPGSAYEELSPAASAHHARAALLAAATPDYRAVAGILLVILMLRRMRHPRKLAPVSSISSGTGSGAAKAEKPSRDLKRAA
jgi:hypothetical protein